MKITRRPRAATLSALILAGQLLLSGCGPTVIVVEPSAPRQTENESVQTVALPSGPNVSLPRLR